MKSPRNIARLFSLTLTLVGLMSWSTLAIHSSSQTAQAATNAGWSNTGNLITARYNHTATLLLNGKTLVAGGRDGTTVLNSAELYDADTGTWSVTGNLNTPRHVHTAALLPNGKVLVTGGKDATDIFSTNALNSAELYDPDTGTWSITGRLKTGRVLHTATLLQNGKVLVAGGDDGRAFTEDSLLNSAELYDPEIGTWSSTGNLITARGLHTAALLQNGKVLVAAGFLLLASPELYDPATGTWSNTGHLNTARWFHTSTLLPNGKVLVAGGFSSSGRELPHSSSELYDPVTGMWGSTGNINVARAYHTTTLLPNGKVLVAGGRGIVAAGPGIATVLNSAELGDDLATLPNAIPTIIIASVAGKKLLVFGENFDPGAVVLLNGEEQITKNDGQNPQTALIGKKAGKRVQPGDKLQVRNPNGTLSQEFTFTGL